MSKTAKQLLKNRHSRCTAHGRAGLQAQSRTVVQAKRPFCPEKSSSTTGQEIKRGPRTVVRVQARSGPSWHDRVQQQSSTESQLLHFFSFLLKCPIPSTASSRVCPPSSSISIPLLSFLRQIHVQNLQNKRNNTKTFAPQQKR